MAGRATMVVRRRTRRARTMAHSILAGTMGHGAGRRPRCTTGTAHRRRPWRATTAARVRSTIG